MSTTVPSVRFALPGRWVKTELADPAAVAALGDLLPDGRAESDTWLDGLRSVGASTLLLRVQSRSTSAIAFIWPPDQASGETSTASLGERLGVDGETVEHEHGYAVVRYRSADADAGQDVVTYGVAHPQTGRILVVRCMAFEHTFEQLELEDLDLAAGDLTWEET